MHNQTKWGEQVFPFSAAVILLVTGIAKLSSVSGSVGILDTQDPVFSFLNTRQLLLLVALLEIAVGIMALLRNMAVQTRLLAIAWLASLFGTYRLGLWLVNYQEPCKCLGGALDWTGLSDAVIRRTTFALFLYLLGGSCILLLASLWQRRFGRKQVWSEGNVTELRKWGKKQNGS